MTFKKYRKLYPMKNSRKFRYVVFDIEASNWVNFKVIGLYDGSKFQYFTSIKDFLAHVLTRKYANFKLMAHAGGRYDFNFILDGLLKYFPEKEFEILSSGSGITDLRVKTKSKSQRRSWVFRDSYRLIPGKLEDLTKSFNVVHKKTTIDYENMDNLPMSEIIEYLKNDCIGLYEVLKKYEQWTESNGGALQATAAKQAISMWRTTLKTPIPCLDEKTEEFVRSSYKGGRVEIFKLRCEDKIYQYDVRSMYPYVMKKYPMPIGNRVWVKRFYDDFAGFYRVKVKVPNLYIPPLPVVQNHKMMFPCGSFEGVYSSIEIEKAIEMGCEVDVKYGVIFPDGYIFDDYIDKYYEIKESSEGAAKVISKLLLNSPYGKFGQNRHKKVIMKAPLLPGYIPYDNDFGLVMKETVSKATFIIPTISATVTSAGRLEMLNLLLKAGAKHIYYCDTDGFCSTKKFNTGKGLGTLKLEKEASRGIFLSPKMYVLDTDQGLEIKAKGFEKELISKLDYNSFDKAMHGNTEDFVQNFKRFATWKEALKRERSFLAMVNRKKTIQTQYNKRIILPDLDTRPIEVRITN